jgi:LysM repeat protein
MNQLAKPAHLRDPYFRAPTHSLGTVADMQAAAMHGNLERNFGVGVGNIALNKGPFQCAPGFDLYAGQCIPRTRVLGAVHPAARSTKAHHKPAAFTPAHAAKPFTTYRVRPGNTRNDIAAMHGVSRAALDKANPRGAGQRLVEGQVLHIPAAPRNLSGPGVALKSNPVAARSCLTREGHAGLNSGAGCKAIVWQHPVVTVQAGDSVTRLAQRHGVTRRAILDANKHKAVMHTKAGVSFARLTHGEKLRMPIRKMGPQGMRGIYGVGDPCSPGDDFDLIACAQQSLPDPTGGSPDPGSPDPGSPDPGADPGGGQTSISGAIFCNDPHAHTDLLSLSCPCDDGYVVGPTGDCELPQIQTGAAAEALCAAQGGTWDGAGCSGVAPQPNIGDSCGANATVGTDLLCHCTPGYDWTTPGGMDCAKTATGGSGGGGGKTTTGGGGTGITKTGGDTKTPDTKTSLTGGPMSSTTKTMMLVGGVGILAIAVGAGAYFYTKPKAGMGAVKGAKGHKPAARAR